MHLACLAVFFTGIHPVAVLICAVSYFIRMFGITGGYHRYFAHRSYKTTRWFQFVLAWLGCMALQKGPLWWAGHHRHHHKYSDTEEDVHSPITRGFWWSHLGWVLSNDYDRTNWKVIRDFARYWELRLLNFFHWVPGILLGFLCWAVGGLAGAQWDSWFSADAAGSLFSYPAAWSSLIVGFFFSTVMLYHGTFAVNSLCHIFGTRRYPTTDKSRNNWWVALFTLGEGWHNNHHHYQSSANQGFFWWEVDISFYVIRALSLCGLVWGVRTPPQNKLEVSEA
jgi:stearoyl-CoA desaturase (Delta-9 desaturase)